MAHRFLLLCPTPAACALLPLHSRESGHGLPLVPGARAALRPDGHNSVPVPKGALKRFPLLLRACGKSIGNREGQDTVEKVEVAARPIARRSTRRGFEGGGSCTVGSGV